MDTPWSPHEFNGRCCLPSCPTSIGLLPALPPYQRLGIYSGLAGSEFAALCWKVLSERGFFQRGICPGALVRRALVRRAVVRRACVNTRHSTKSSPNREARLGVGWLSPAASPLDCPLASLAFWGPQLPDYSLPSARLYRRVAIGSKDIDLTAHSIGKPHSRGSDLNRV